MVALLDGEGRIQQLCRVNPETSEPVVNFLQPYESELHVVDAQNQPIAGAVVEQMLRQYGTSGDAVFRPFLGYRWRFAGTSDAMGRAPLRMVSDSPTPTGWLRIEAGGVCCYAVETRVSKAKELRVVMPPLQVQPGEVRGIREEEIAFAQLSTHAEFHADKGSHGLEMQLPLLVTQAGQLSIAPTPVTSPGSSLLMQLVPRREGVPRHLLLACNAEPADRLPSLDLGTLRSWHLRAVDANNNPLPGAAVKVIGTSKPRSILAVDSMELILDHGGRAELLLDESEWGIYATIGTEHALAFVDAGRNGGELMLRLEPLPTARLRVIDANGKPVAHARSEVRGGSPYLERVAKETLKNELGALIASTTSRAARSGNDGMLIVPVQDWARVTLKAQVHAGDLVSESFELASGDDVVEVLVR